MNNFIHHPASFRDPAGFMFRADGILYRQVNLSHAQDYDLFMNSGLYPELVTEQLLIPHTEADIQHDQSSERYKTLRPEQLGFISYPYEWSFHMLQDAALLTLMINRKSIRKGVILKDASAYNIQFRNGRPVFIDTLSFQRYDASRPWIAYRQFCEMFLFPLYLMHYRNADLFKLLIAYPEGIPVEVTADLLPSKSRLALGVWLHVLLQQNIGGRRTNRQYSHAFNVQKMNRLLDHLGHEVRRLHLPRSNSAWSNYYDGMILGDGYLQAKLSLLKTYIALLPVESVLDLGCNDGYFSGMFAAAGKKVIAVDSDSLCIDRLYISMKAGKTGALLPLCIDITNPSPASGLGNEERASFLERAKTDMLLALALVHHLVIGKNIPLEKIAALFSRLAGTAIVEFIPADDEKVKELLENRDDIHHDYDQAAFERAFGFFYETVRKETIQGTSRVLYLFRKK